MSSNYQLQPTYHSLRSRRAAELGRWAAKNRFVRHLVPGRDLRLTLRGRRGNLGSGDLEFRPLHISELRVDSRRIWIGGDHMLRATFGLVLLLATCGASAETSQPATPVGPCGAAKSASMLLLNFQAPFVSENFAKRMAQITIEEKYPRSAFSSVVPGVAVDAGATWKVTLRNSLVSPGDTSYIPEINGGPTARELTVEICKDNAAVLGIS